MPAVILAVGTRYRLVAIGLGRFIRSVAVAIWREDRTHREMGFLMEQDDRVLDDIGITRCEVEQAVRGWRR